MKSTPEQIDQIVAFIKERRGQYRYDTQCVIAAFQASGATFYKDATGRYMRLAGFASKSNVDNGGPLEAIRSAEAQIRKALADLDSERDRLMNRIKELDNTVAKYKQ